MKVTIFGFVISFLPSVSEGREGFPLSSKSGSRSGDEKWIVVYSVHEIEKKTQHTRKKERKKKSDEEESIIPCKPVFNCCNKGNAEESFSMMMVTLGVSSGRELLCFSFSPLFLSPPFLFYKLDRSRKERRKRRRFLQESSSWKSSFLSLVKQLLSPSTQHFSRAQELVPVGTCLTSLSLSLFNTLIFNLTLCIPLSDSRLFMDEKEEREDVRRKKKENGSSSQQHQTQRNQHPCLSPFLFLSLSPFLFLSPLFYFFLSPLFHFFLSPLFHFFLSLSSLFLIVRNFPSFISDFSSLLFFDCSFLSPPPTKFLLRNQSVQS